MHDPCNGILSTKRKDTKIWSPFVDRKCFYHTKAWHAIIFGDRYILNLEYWNSLPSKQPVTMIWCLLNIHAINRRNRIYLQIYNQTIWIPSTIVNRWMSGLKHLYNIDKCNMHCQIRRKSKWEINFAFIAVTYGYNISYEVWFSQVCDWMRLYLKRLILIRLKNWS